ncbi:MAG: glycoside hydrolase 43 family protein [Verrucomicrobia bacterium]|nr:glycoside hydrolase 43 family protein [Verrucomicrobiota bacterium]
MSSSSASAPWLPDLGDGRYQNPVLFADYSDPDAIRVGDDYWLTSSSFNHVPGLPILHSRDLVNWSLVNHALPTLVPRDHFATPRHGAGVWAPSIRHHAGKFWIYYPDPDFGLYVVTATDPRGAWSEPVLVKAGRGLIDPCPLWDDDGRVWLVHAWARSRSGKNNIVQLNELSADGMRVLDGEGVAIIDENHSSRGFHTLEGPKLYKRGDTYWIFAPVDGVATGSQAVYRSPNLRGPWEARIVLAQGTTAINGPHQGACVDTPAGEHWFLHFQDRGPFGRIVHLQPMSWHADGWPRMGNASGEPVLTHATPKVGTALRAVLSASPRLAPATSDEFDSPALGRQWQWQANPRPDFFSLAARPGYLRLPCHPRPASGSLYDTPHLLLQKFPAPAFTATTLLDAAGLSAEASAQAGLMIFGYSYAWLGLRQTVAGPTLVQVTHADAHQAGTAHDVAAVPVSSPRVWLRATVSVGAACLFAYSLDGETFVAIGDAFQATVAKWVGAKIGLFASSATASPSSGHADFDFFRLTS